MSFHDFENIPEVCLPQKPEVIKAADLLPHGPQCFTQLHQIAKAGFMFTDVTVTRSLPKY
jgi:hypothetical protein